MLPHEPTPETRAQVEALTGYGVVQEEVGRYLGIDDKTLRKHYRAELDGAVIRANADVARHLHKMATEGGNVAAAIFWMKVRAGWTEKNALELSGQIGVVEIPRKDAVK